MVEMSARVMAIPDFPSAMSPVKLAREISNEQDTTKMATTLEVYKSNDIICDVEWQFGLELLDDYFRYLSGSAFKKMLWVRFGITSIWLSNLQHTRANLHIIPSSSAGEFSVTKLVTYRLLTSEKSNRDHRSTRSRLLARNNFVMNTKVFERRDNTTVVFTQLHNITYARMLCTLVIGNRSRTFWGTLRKFVKSRLWKSRLQCNIGVWN